jgi:hypothetical protein
MAAAVVLRSSDCWAAVQLRPLCFGHAAMPCRYRHQRISTMFHCTPAMP